MPILKLLRYPLACISILGLPSLSASRLEALLEFATAGLRIVGANGRAREGVLSCTVDSLDSLDDDGPDVSNGPSLHPRSLVVASIIVSRFT